MPQLKSRKKSLRRDIKRRILNRARKRAMKAAIKRALEVARTGTDEELQEAIAEAYRMIDRAAQKGPLHRHAAARKKSRLMVQITKIRAELAAKQEG